MTEGKITTVVCWVVCHATENEESVAAAVRYVTGEKAAFESRKAEAHFHQPMKLIYARMRGEGALERIISTLGPEDREELLRTLEERIDDSNTLHFRLDKQSCFLGSPRLSSKLDERTRREHDSIEVEVRAATYPGSRENAVKFIYGVLHDLNARGQG